MQPLLSSISGFFPSCRNETLGPLHNSPLPTFSFLHDWQIPYKWNHAELVFFFYLQDTGFLVEGFFFQYLKNISPLLSGLQSYWWEIWGSLVCNELLPSCQLKILSVFGFMCLGVGLFSLSLLSLLYDYIHVFHQIYDFLAIISSNILSLSSSETPTLVCSVVCHRSFRMFAFLQSFFFPFLTQ